MFVEWARIHGIYDPAIGSTRQVIYNLDIAAIWNHQFDFLKIDSLEDVPSFPRNNWRCFPYLY